MLRVQFVKNAAAKKPKASTIGVLKAELTPMKTFASTKFRIKRDKVRLFICRNSPAGVPGTELLTDQDVLDYVANDTLIAVSDGKEYLGLNAKVKKDAGQLAAAVKKLTVPPRFPYPTVPLQNHEGVPTDSAPAETTLPPKKFLQLPERMELSGQFPILDGDVLMGIRQAIKDYPLIKETERAGWISFDYTGQFDYPPVTDWMSGVVRECRGLLISPVTGKVMARRFHKFFNLNQVPEANESELDLTDAVIYDKIDGSLVSPVKLDSGETRWGFRRSWAREVERHVTPAVAEFVEEVMALNRTPLFEWCPAWRSVGVIRYKETKLVLTAIRDNVTGEYYPLPTDGEIPVAREKAFGSLPELKDEIGKATGIEGVVIASPDGRRWKLKSPWWLNMSQAAKVGGKNHFLPEMIKLNGTLKSIPKERVWETVLMNNDDTISAVLTAVTDHAERAAFHNFHRLTWLAISALEQDLIGWVTDGFKLVGDKGGLIAFLDKHHWPEWIVHDVIKKRKLTDKLVRWLLQYLREDANAAAVEGILDLVWEVTGPTVDQSHEIIGLESGFETAPSEVVEHVLENYLPRKISSMLGVKTVSDVDGITIDSNYMPDEGRIKGMWEMFTKLNIHHLRIDLQPSDKSGFNGHNGDPNNALLLVQYGLFKHDEKAPYGNYAGVLLPTGNRVTVSEIREALRMSFQTLKLVRIRRQYSDQLASDFKIFCDLDGVLADFAGEVLSITGRRPEDQKTGTMWQKILSHSGFFRSLDWMDDGEELWKHLCGLGQPSILTGVPIGSRKQVVKEKRQWCTDKLGTEVEVITCQSEEKWKWSSRGHILIDDRYQHKQMWESYGGTFIHHVSTERTKYELERLLGKLKTLAVSDTIVTTPYTLTTPIVWVRGNDKWYPNHDSVVGIDTEWITDTRGTRLCLIQMAMSDMVYLIDPIELSQKNWNNIHSILNNPRITKVGFDMSEGDLYHLGTDIIGVIDLQEWALDHLEYQWAGSRPSLQKLAGWILDRKLNKSKELQAGDWSKRPLSKEQKEYAAIDAVVVRDMLEKLPISIPPRNYVSRKRVKEGKVHEGDNGEFDLTLPVKIVYLGIFLTTQSREQLLQLIEPIHGKVLADHVTLSHRPSEAEIADANVGVEVEFTVVGVYGDERKQAVLIDLEGRRYHVTISTHPSVPSKESNEITEWEFLESPFVLQGKTGALVERYDDPLVVLSDHVRRRIQDFHRTAQVGEKLSFRPGELSAAERAIIHQFAEGHDIESRSSGKRDRRKMELVMRRRREATEGTDRIFSHASELEKEAVGADNEPRTKRIADTSQYWSLNIVGEKAKRSTSGEVVKGMIRWRFPPRMMLMDRVMYILRGLPGSGKSSVCIILDPEAVICSADHYFITDKGYKFDERKLGLAHQSCLDRARESMEAGLNVIIDNTNSRLNEYRKYIELANELGYEVAVIELLCRTRDEAEAMGHRTVHKVPMEAVMRMWNRWQMDPNSLLLEPYQPRVDGMPTIVGSGISFDRWLSDNHLAHFNKKRRVTHLLMAVGERPATFLDVPPEMMQEFHQRFLCSGITGAPDDEPKYVAEMPGDKFRMFIDLDYVDEEQMSDDLIKQLALSAMELTESTVYVAGCFDTSEKGIKTGVHVIVDKVVDRDEALDLRAQLVRRMMGKDPSYPWDEILDEDVYRGKVGFRMLGSRKVTKKIDKGRIYRPLWMVTSKGDVEDLEYDESILDKMSVLAL